MDVRPGSMGRPLPGIEAAIVRRTGEQASRGRRHARHRGRARAAARLAVDVPRLSVGRRTLPEVLRRRLLPHRRSRQARSRRLLLVHRPRRRRDQVVRAPDRPVRGRERAARASGGRRSRRDRQARSGGARNRQGVRRAEAGSRTERRAAPGAARLRARAARRRRRAEGDRFPAEHSEEPRRQDHAPAAEGAGTGPARRATSRRWRRHDAAALTTPQPVAARDGRDRAAAARDAAHPPLRGEVRGAVQRRQDSRLPASLYRRGSGRGRRHAGARRATMPSSRPIASTVTRWRAASPSDAADGRDVRQAARAAAAAAADRCTSSTRRRASTAATRSSAAVCRSRSASRSPTRCSSGRASRPASSAMAPSPRASFTNR